jgi:hypothetical protein
MYVYDGLILLGWDGFGSHPLSFHPSESLECCSIHVYCIGDHALVDSRQTPKHRHVSSLAPTYCIHKYALLYLLRCHLLNFMRACLSA